MGVPRLILLEYLRDLGRPGLAGALLLAAALAYGLAAVVPAGEERARLRDRAARAEAALDRAARRPADASAAPGGTAASPLPSLPVQGDVSRWVERIYGLAAAEGLILARGEYALAPVADTRLARYRIFLPVQGGYLQIRRFVDSAQAEVPGLGLEDLSLQRRDIGEPRVEALIRFSLYLARP